MPERPSELAELAFRDLIATNEVQFIKEDGDLHIAGDDWTLVLEGDPVTDVLVALEDEVGTPEQSLQSTFSDAALTALRDLNGQMEGELVSLLIASPDLLAHSLAELLDR